jgi:peptidyl-dipeptidase Dcp
MKISAWCAGLVALSASFTAPLMAQAPAASATTNVLLQPYTGPYGGVPAFDKMDLAALKPALEVAMAKNLAEVEAIASNPAPANFENTIVALERSGREMRQANIFLGLWAGNLSTPAFRAVQREMAPRLADFNSKITQHAALFARVKAVHDSAEVKTLRPDQQRLVKLVYERFAINGATLQGPAQARYAAIQKRLASLHTTFGNNVLADEEGEVTYLNKSQLGGLPEALVTAAAAAAKERRRAGEYAITNTRSSMDPFLTFAENRAMREQVWRRYYARGDMGNANDNNAVIAEILQLRHERVQLLGQPSYAAWRLQDRMAQTPERALALMEAEWKPAVARVKEEVADMQRIADQEGQGPGLGIRIEPWDYRYYAEKVRKERYDLDSDEVKQYLQLDRLREGMFFVAGKVFGYRFTPVPEGSVPVFHPDVRVWEVTDQATGAHIGLWYLDAFARTGKRSGAWAGGYRGHETFDGKKTVLSSNNSNFVKAAPGQPVLVSWDDAETFFHEFGHALHGLASNVAYPTLNGGVRDYTEFQSQLLERWLLTDEVIKGFLVHAKTGKPMPAELVAKIRKAKTFNQGFERAEYLASAILDMRYHMVDPKGIDPRAFERKELERLGLPRQVVMRHRSPHFSHIFSGEGYAAGYYGYLWADVLTADAAEAFEAAPGGYYDAALSKRLVALLFAPRNAIDPVEAYRAFRGRDAEIAPLMRNRGFAPPLPK